MVSLRTDNSLPADSSAATGLDYRGFSLKDVCWGYREIFRETIDELYRQGHLGSERRRVTEKFFELLRLTDRGGMDHVVKNFLEALRYGPRWLLDLPQIFSDVVDLGRKFSEEQLSYGVKYFAELAAGSFGNSPREVHELVRHMRWLSQHEGSDLALALLEGYKYLLARMDLHELGRYIDVGVDIYRRNPARGCRFLKGVLRTSETYINNITREVRLEDCNSHLTRLVKAFTGDEIKIDHLGQLNSDDLLERGSSVVCCPQGLYLPARVATFPHRWRNREYYVVATMTAVAALVADSFSQDHGLTEENRTAAGVAPGQDVAEINPFVVLEYARILRYMRCRWPGIREAMDWFLKEELVENQPPDGPEELLGSLCLTRTDPPNSVQACNALLDQGYTNYQDAAELIDRQLVETIVKDYPDIAIRPIRPFSFIPDFLFPMSVSPPPSGKALLDLHEPLNKPAGKPDDASEAQNKNRKVKTQTGTSAIRKTQEPTDDSEQSAEAGYVYDEWNQQDADYLHDYCLVNEVRVPNKNRTAVPEDVFTEGRRVSRAFERIKPEDTAREKHLAEGDFINEDLLLTYMVEKKKWPAPRVNFYEKVTARHRDLGVLILLDCSGSTGETREEARTIDLETHATVVLSEALATLGDRFAACGFNSSGPQSVFFYVFKDFDENWNREKARLIRGAQPANSTRIGAAVRHAGWRLSRESNKQKLILLVTDGRPQDQAYDPNTFYAQHDVRTACQENARLGVHTFGISTTANIAADMQLMFGKHHVLLRQIKQLPLLLPRLYSRLTF